MAEENVNSDGVETLAVENQLEEEKKTNRTFSQSDFDVALARDTKKLRDQIKGTDALQAEIEALRKDKEEKDLAEKSELEKAQIQVQKLQEKIDTSNTENQKLIQATLAAQILSDVKYRDLPNAYKRAIDISGDEESIRTNADSALEEYANDFKGKIGQAFGKPIQKSVVKHEPEKTYDSPEEMSRAIRAKMNAGYVPAK